MTFRESSFTYLHDQDRDHAVLQNKGFTQRNGVTNGVTITIAEAFKIAGRRWASGSMRDAHDARLLIQEALSLFPAMPDFSFAHGYRSRSLIGGFPAEAPLPNIKPSELKRMWEKYYGDKQRDLRIILTNDRYEFVRLLPHMRAFVTGQTIPGKALDLPRQQIEDTQNFFRNVIHHWRISGAINHKRVEAMCKL